MRLITDRVTNEEEEQEEEEVEEKWRQKHHLLMLAGRFSDAIRDRQPVNKLLAPMDKINELWKYSSQLTIHFFFFFFFFYFYPHARRFFFFFFISTREGSLRHSTSQHLTFRQLKHTRTRSHARDIIEGRGCRCCHCRALR